MTRWLAADDGKPKPEFLVEAKAAHIKSLNEKHIEQAENYAQRSAVNWVLLTNGVDWQLYHLTFDNNGSHPDLVFKLDFLDALEKDPDLAWDTLSVLAKNNVEEGSLDDYYEQQKLLSPKTIVATLVGEEVLMKIRQELNRKAPARLELKGASEVIEANVNGKPVGLRFCSPYCFEVGKELRAGGNRIEIERVGRIVLSNIAPPPVDDAVVTAPCRQAILVPR